MRSLITTLAIALMVTSVAPPAMAQIVNVQPLLSGEEPNGLSGQVAGSLTWNTGSVDLFLGKADLLLKLRIDDHRLISSSSGTLGVKNGEDFMESVFSHLRWQWDLGDYLTWEVYGQVASDRFRRLSLRGLGGTGPKLHIARGSAVDFAIGLSYMFEHEHLGTSGSADSGASTNHHRVSTYLTGKFLVAPLLTIQGTAYFQPRLDAFIEDFRVLGDLSLGINLTDSLGLAVTFNLTYDADPPAEVSDLDTSTTVSFSFGF